MKELTLHPDLSIKIGKLYFDMQQSYDAVAIQLDFTCINCPDNCCDSYFQHHTYVEWAYLWEGLKAIDLGEFNKIMAKAETYVSESETLLRLGKRPQLMCPLNDSGLCSIYSHRLMICRLHGVPATLTKPDGNLLRFPGCFKCQEEVIKIKQNNKSISSLERAELYRRLVELEIDLLSDNIGKVPKVKLTLAQMLVSGPPRLP